MIRSIDGAVRLAVPVFLAVMTACGGDSTGPKHNATSIEANSSTSIVAPAGTTAPESPSVIVRDENGNPLAGATVLFTVTGGDGAVSGASVRTGSDGVATVGTWTLGSNAAVNTVDATVEGLPALTFTATAGNPCAVTPPYTIGATTNGRLGPADCQVSDGSFVDFWSVTVPATGTYLFNQASTSINSYLLLLTADFHVFAQNDDASTASPNSTIKAILPAGGTFLIGANSLDPQDTGPYTLTSGPTSNPVSNCEDVFVAPGISTDQSLQTTDCLQNGFYSDDYILFLNTGQSMTAAMASAAVDPYLELYDFQVSTTTPIRTNDDADPTTKNASISYTAPHFGYFFVKARTTSASTTGAYTLTIQ